MVSVPGYLGLILEGSSMMPNTFLAEAFAFEIDGI